MNNIITLKNHTPKFEQGAFITHNTTIIGDVVAGKNCSFWYQSIIRGDVNSIRIGNKTNIQDGAIIHCTYKKTGTYIGDNVSIGHKAIIHGCTIHHNVLIGMGAIIMDNAIIESNSIIAAGAIVTENTRVTSGTIYAGIPAKKIGNCQAKHFAQITQTAKNYVKYASWY